MGQCDDCVALRPALPDASAPGFLGIIEKGLHLGYVEIALYLKELEEFSDLRGEWELRCTSPAHGRASASQNNNDNAPRACSFEREDADAMMYAS